MRRWVSLCFTAVLVSCGGSGGSGGNSVTNSSPTANAGADQSVNEQALVTLDGSASQDPDGSIQTYQWSQTSGGSVVLSGASTASATFNAPALSMAETLTFQLQVTDDGNQQDIDTVSVTVNPVAGMNNAPVANAGADQTVTELSTVNLNGTASNDNDGSIEIYQWQQTDGPPVALTDADTATPSFTAPDVATATDLVFALTVTDNEGATATESVTVTVQDDSLITTSGKITFDLVPVATTPVRLDYTATQVQAARAVTVQLIDASDGVTVLGTASTDENGDYSIIAPMNTNVFVRVRAEMIRAGAPSWDFRVVDNTAGNALYVMDGVGFNTGNASSVRNLHAPSGWGGAGYTSPRVAAPFALLDVVYESAQLVLSADPSVAFPALVMHWSPNNVPTFGDESQGEIGTSFFRSGSGIFVLGAENDDTDEYDRHVVAHEWGHYFEDVFSRSDSIGGPHAITDQLDMRVAFGEGFGNAISGMTLADSVYRDAFGNLQASGFSFDVEGRNGSSPGWYSEESIQELLYDLFDAAQDTAEDALALGFGPIYDVLTDQQRNSVALTSIFPFIDALKADRPADAAMIDALVGAQSITVVADEYGSTESNSGNPPNADTLPIYESITINDATPINVCSTNDFASPVTDSTNKLGSRRYLRFTTAVSGNHTFTATTTSAPANESTDPDMILHQRELAFVSEDPPDMACTPVNLAACRESFTIALTAGDYVLEVYEWTNTNPGDANDPDPPIGRACFDVEITQP